VLKYLSHPRWLWWHLLSLAVTFGFTRLGFWQWNRRLRQIDEQTSVVDWQNTLYAFQWWVFAGFVVWFWWKFVSDSYRLNELEKNEIRNN